MILLAPWWLLPAGLCVAAWWFITRHSGDSWPQVIKPEVLSYLRPVSQYGRRHTTYLVAAIAALALCGPSIPQENSQSFRHSQGWIILADVSRSMTLTDIAPTRLSAMRETLLQIADQASANSISLIIYAGDAFIIAPPSYDTANFRENANLLEHGLIPLEGSNVTRALSLAYSVIESSQLINARLLILSDTGGFNNRSDAAVARLAAAGHRSDVILFGTEDTTSAAPFDVNAAQSMTNSGGGKLIFANALRGADLAPLSLDRLTLNNKLLSQTGLSTLHWSNQSHWLLLLALPLMILLFYREQH